MADDSRLVPDFKGARPGLSPAIPAASHQRALTLGQDVPESLPSFQIGLSEVGISGQTVWILLPQGRLPFEAEVYVDLPENVRGIHMSRIGEAISEVYPKNFADIRLYARELAGLVLEKQRGRKARILVKGKIPLVRKTSVSEKYSVDSVEIEAQVRAECGAEGLSLNTMIGIKVYHLTACPCTQVYNSSLAGEDGRDFPMPTHSQRSLTSLTMEDHKGDLSYDDLLDCLEKSLHVTQGLLKRPDEAEIVLQAHRRPQFAEDVVREAARQAGITFGGRLPASNGVIIESLSLESIHTHDVRCTVRMTLGDILSVLADAERSAAGPP